MANTQTKKAARTNGGRENQRKIVVRQARMSDVVDIAALSRRVYAPEPGYSQRAIRSQIINFQKANLSRNMKARWSGIAPPSSSRARSR